MHGLYAIIDAETLVAAGLDVLRFADAVLQARPAAMQLRDKRPDARTHLGLLRALVPRCDAANVALFGNDRADLALLAGCRGLHVGQHDLSPSAVRELAAAVGARELAVGMSVHNDDELEVAIAERPDYIAIGPVFATRSKADPDPTLGPRGLAALAREVRERTGLPRVAIGGIEVSTVAAVAPHCEMAAVIGALVDVQSSDPYEAATRRARALGAALQKGHER